ncbi:hypothetical protein LPB86_13330 [Pedobacter sp. MC2016-14]|uniref:hypothetical protein n=1 Tax=Pedobacter sp. MC2016-14 TaxID=2897327 RepID=UPI001E402573|nr:hypothetical protein [Pedobacter sp. MC2016-14]MCD0489216.1 hypothetical protein [Pedobacter sp. MC2016-14]
MNYPIVIVPFLNAEGMAIFPFIFIKDKSRRTDETLIRHETIHIKQQLELLIIPFYLAYLLNYLINLFKHKSHHQAYRNIIFEKEAYACDHKTDYLINRQSWAWIKYFCI